MNNLQVLGMEINVGELKFYCKSLKAARGSIPLERDHVSSPQNLRTDKHQYIGNQLVESEEKKVT